MSTNARSNQPRVTAIGFGMRLAATLLDGIIVLFLSFVIVMMIGILLSVVLTFFTQANPFPFTGVFVLIALLVSLVYYLGFWSKSGSTPGKNLLGIKVVGKDGGKLSVGKAFVRYLGYILSGAMLSLGFLWIVFDKKRQGWHDKLAGTLVVYEEDEFTDGIEVVPADPGKGWLWVILWAVLALTMPGVLLLGLWALGPVVSRFIIGLIAG